MTPQLVSYTVGISDTSFLMDWVIIRGPQYLVGFTELNFIGDAEYVLGVF